MRSSRSRAGVRRALATPTILRPRAVGASSDPTQPALVAGGRVIPIASRGVVTLGKGTRADVASPSSVVLHGPHVSASHAQVHGRGDGLWLEDLDSTNGTWRRGQRLGSCGLEDGDCLMLGRTPVLVGRTVPGHQAGTTATAGRQPTIRWRGIIAADPLSLRTLEQVGQLAACSAAVWIRGASGTGKERIAHALHGASPRSQGPFVSLNCAALPASLAESELFGSARGAFTGATDRDGAFTRADGGTLFLDEVGELPLSIQAKLLRVLETGELRPVGSDTPRKVDVRVVSATWRDLEEEAESARFRFDLLHRLGVLRLRVPDLAARPQDIGPLIEAFLEEFGATGLQTSPEMWFRLRRYRWPGNVRELRNATQRAALAGSWSAIGIDRLDGCVTDSQDPFQKNVVPKRRKGIARRAVRVACGNRARAARALGVSRSTLYRWLGATG